MIPLWAISAIGAAAVAGIGAFTLASKLGDAKLARAEAGWAQERANAATAYAAKEAEFRATEARQMAEKAKSIEVANEQVGKLQAALSRERASGIGLRSQFGAFVAESTRAAETATTEFQRATARAAGDLQVLVLERVDRAAGVIAEHADRARVAGLACEREYEIVTR